MAIQEGELYFWKELKNKQREPGEAGSNLWSRRFSGFYGRPSKEICQSFENRSEHAQNANITRGHSDAREAQHVSAISVQDLSSIR